MGSRCETGGRMTSHRSKTNRSTSIDALSAWSKAWLAGFVKPSASTFRAAAEPPWANSQLAFAVVLVAGVVTTVAGLLSATLHPGTPALLWANSPSSLRGVLLQFLAYPASFLIDVAVMQLIARILGGRGTFSQLSFLLAVYSIPIGVVSFLVLAGAGPSFLIFPILCLLPLYSFALRYVAVRAVHRLSPAAALAAMIPGVIASSCVTVSFYLAVYPWPQQFIRPAL